MLLKAGETTTSLVTLIAGETNGIVDSSVASTFGSAGHDGEGEQQRGRTVEITTTLKRKKFSEETADIGQRDIPLTKVVPR